MVCFSNYLHLYDGVIREVQIVKTTKFLRNKFYGMYMQTTMSWTFHLKEKVFNIKEMY